MKSKLKLLLGMLSVVLFFSISSLPSNAAYNSCTHTDNKTVNFGRATGTIGYKSETRFYINCSAPTNVRVTVSNWGTVNKYNSFRFEQTGNIGSGKYFGDSAFIDNQNGSKSILLHCYQGQNAVVISNDYYSESTVNAIPDKNYTVTVAKTNNIGDVFTSGGLKYKITHQKVNSYGDLTKSHYSDNRVTIIGCTGLSGYQIGDSVNYNTITYNVAEIAKKAFAGNKQVKSIFVNSSKLEKIGTGAFQNCPNLRKAEFAKVKDSQMPIMVKQLFKNDTALTSVVLPSNYWYAYKSISDEAFYGCKKLTKIENLKYVEKVGNKAFYNCKKLKKFTSTTIKKIGKEAFKNCSSLKSIDFSGSTQLSSVGKNAFKGINKKAKIKTRYIKDMNKIKKAGAPSSAKYSTSYTYK